MPPQADEVHARLDNGPSMTYRYHAMRDVLADAANQVHRFKQHPAGAMCREFSCRTIACIWQCQTPQDSDKTSTNGPQIKIKEDGVGAELSQILSKVAHGRNILNHLVRTGGQNMKSIAKKMTLGRLSVVGDKGMALQKRITAQKAAYATTKNAQQKQKITLTVTPSDAIIPDKALGGKVESFGEYAQTHANIPIKSPDRLKPPARDTPGGKNKTTKPGVPSPTSTPTVARSNENNATRPKDTPRTTNNGKKVATSREVGKRPQPVRVKPLNEKRMGTWQPNT